MAGGREAVEARHLDVEDDEVGLELADELDGFVAPAGLADDVVALLLEDLLEVEADDGLVLGDDDAGRTARLSGHEGSRWSARRQFGRDAVEERVLLLLELADRRPQRLGVARLGVGVAAGVAGLDVGERGLRHERPQPYVLGFLLEEAQLLVGDRELGPDPLQALADVDEAPLEERLRHRRGILDPGVLKHIQLVADTDNTVIRRIVAFLIALGVLALSPVAAHAADDSGRDPLTLAKQRLDAARAEATDISGRISAAQTDEAKLEAEISAAEANIPQLRARATELKAIVKQRAAELYVRYGETAAFESAMEAENAEDGLRAAAPHRHHGHAGSRRREQAAGDRGRARGT